MQTPFFLALLAALMLHVVGLAAVSLGWKAWRVSFALSQPDTPALVAVVPVPEPVPPPEPTPEPVTPAESVAIPPADTAPEPIPTTPVMSAPMAPPQGVPPPPLKRIRPRPKPTLSAQVAQAQTPTSTPTRERLPRPSLLAPGRPDEPLGSADSGTAGAPSPPAAPAPELPQNPGPGGGADAGQLSAHGDVPVAPGSGTGGGGARVSTGGGASGSTGAGRGGSGGVSARPVGGYQVKPRYPESARRQGVEGTVLLKMRITEQGRVEDVQVERSAGHPDLDRSAMEAVQRWRFEPARRSGEPVAVWVLIPVEFKLQ